MTKGHVRVLMYHRFSPEGEDHPRRLPEREFAWQLTYLEKYHSGWTPEMQLGTSVLELCANDGPPVVITVDDGYADFAKVAFPLLNCHHFPTTVFVTTGFISGNTWFWWDRLNWLLDNCAPGKYIFNIAGNEVQGDTCEEDLRWSLWHAIATPLSAMLDNEKEMVLTDLATQLALNIPTIAPVDYMALTWDQVRELKNKGILFGAHTVNHPVLSRVDPDRARMEIIESANQLGAETNCYPSWFCLPQGGPDDFSQDTIEYVRQAGYQGCYTAFSDPWHNGDTMTLPRYSVSTDRTDFQWVLCGAEYLIMRWKRKLSGKQPN